MTSAGRALAVGAMLMGLSGPAAAVVYEVNATAACPGSGTADAPFCAIGSAAAIAAPGDTVNVAKGIYREQVTPANSGAAGSPITYHGAPEAKIYGTNDLSGAALWTLSSDTTYAAYFNPPPPSSNPRQVFIDGVALAESLDGASPVPVNGFYYDSATTTLFVNLGGDNPGDHGVEAGARSLGFNVDTRSHLVIDGFETYGQNTNGIRVRSSANIAVRANRVHHARSFGLVADGTTAPTTTGPIEISGNEVLQNGDSGIRLRTNVLQATVRNNHSHDNRNHGLLATDTTDSVFSGNVLHGNAKPGGVSTTGLILDVGSHRNRVERNLAYENQDSGFQVSGDALIGKNLDNVLLRNISYANGDHGYDIRECNGVRLVSNTSTGNFNDGFSIEGNVSNAYLRNNIAAENSLTTGGNELWVDATSTAGFSSDYDILWRSSASHTVEYGGGVYDTLADFKAATGHEAHGIGANPNFVNPAADNFHPGLGPAIDAADASAIGFQALDFDGFKPVDIKGVRNTGVGSPNYADRGAFERRGDTKPVARLTLTPTTALIGQPVTADGSASSDDGGIVSYRFEWGDGTPATVQGDAIATHTFAKKGKFKVKLTVTDGAGQTASAVKSVAIQ